MPVMFAVSDWADAVVECVTIITVGVVILVGISKS